MIYLAPLQGFTDFVYRKSYSEVFSGVDAFYIPYISMKNDEFPKKYNKEICAENNEGVNAVPQILVKDAGETLALSERLQALNYQEVNLNLGCPYPMVTKRGKGSGLLPHPEKIEEILAAFTKNFSMQLSVKLRLGLEETDEIEAVIPMLNKFSLKEVIVHPRVGKQLYKGKIHEAVFAEVLNELQHEVVYNGDIFSLEDFQQKQTKFPSVKSWMLGRGILMNPFLPAEMLGNKISEVEREEKLAALHQSVFEKYAELMDNPGNTLNKMQQFWEYFSYNFPNQRKVLKKIKKAKNLDVFQAEVKSIL